MKPYQVLMYSFCGSLLAVAVAWLLVFTVGSYILSVRSQQTFEQFGKDMGGAFPGR